MQDFLDFLSWLGFTILAAAVFGFSGVLGTTALTGPELCVSFAGGSSAFLLCRGLGRRATQLSSWIGQSASDRQSLGASLFERA